MDKIQAKFIAYRTYSAYSKLISMFPEVVSKKDKDTLKSDLELEITKNIMRAAADISLDILNPIFKEYPEIEEEIGEMVKKYKISPC